MVMPCEVIATSSSNGMQLMIREEMPKLPTGSGKRIIETVVRIVHLIGFEHGLQATLVETCIVGHEWDGGYLIANFFKCLLFGEECFAYSIFYLLPYFRKHRCIIGILMPKPMHPLTEVAVVVRLGLDKAVERVYHLTVPYQHHAYGADARRVLIGCLEIYGYEVAYHITFW